MLTKLKYGNTNTYFCDGLLIDTDFAGTLPAFYKEIKQYGISIQDIRYVIATHYHPDHMGLVSELMEQGVCLVIMENQLSFVHYSDEIFARQKNLNYKPIREDEAVVRSFSDSRSFLSSLGISGEILPTASHSMDGIVLLLDDGNCFVGDLEPREFIDAYTDNTALKQDWDMILRYNPQIIHFGHANDQNL